MLCTPPRLTGLDSKAFALRLLQEKRCAVAPGIAFNTYCSLAGSEPAPGSAAAAQKQAHLEMLNGFCRVSLASSEQNVTAGVAAVCDLLDEIAASGDVVE
jgi:aspartate/methionine/tyrosine aminotransferase